MATDDEQRAGPEGTDAGEHRAVPPPARNIFVDDPGVEREAARIARRRAAKWGAATGGVMAVLLMLCVFLLYLAAQSAN